MTTSDEALRHEITAALQADPVCNGRVSTGTIDYLAGIIARQRAAATTDLDDLVSRAHRLGTLEGERHATERATKVVEGPWEVPTMETKLNGKLIADNDGNTIFASDKAVTDLLKRIAAAIRNQGAAR